MSNIENLKPFFQYFLSNRNGFFKDYKTTFEEFYNLIKNNNIELSSEIIEGVKIYLEGEKKIINSIIPYVKQVNEKQRIQSKNIILFYSLDSNNLKYNNLLIPDNNTNIKDKINNIFKGKEINFTFLATIPYYANLFVYIVLEEKPTIRNFYNYFNLKDLNFELDFALTVKFNKTERYDKKLYDYFLTFPCNAHLKINNQTIENAKEEQKLTLKSLLNVKNKFELIDICNETPLKYNSLAKTYDNITALERLRKEKERGKNIKLLDWQNNFLTEIKEQINNNIETRKVIWIFDKLGCAGKSVLAKYLLRTDPDFFIITTIGQQKDFFEKLYNSYMNNMWTGKCLILDFPRTYEEKNSLYTCLEIVKNGYIEKDKYNSTCIDFIDANKLIIIVFANFLPEFCKLSLDRWDIRELKHYNKLTNQELTKGDICRIKLENHKVEIIKWNTKQIYQAREANKI